MLLPELDLGRAEAAQLGAELAAARRTCVDFFAERPLEVLHRDVECVQEPLGDLDAAVGEGIPLERIRGFRDRRLEPRAKLVELRSKRSPASLQLEQQRLGGLAREPQLTTLRVVPEALRCHRRDRRRQQLLLRDDGHLGNELGGIPADQDDEAAEPRLARSLEQCERSGRVVPNHGGGRTAERGRDRALAAGLHLE